MRCTAAKPISVARDWCSGLASTHWLQRGPNNKPALEERLAVRAEAEVPDNAFSSPPAGLAPSTQPSGKRVKHGQFGFAGLLKIGAELFNWILGLRPRRYE